MNKELTISNHEIETKHGLNKLELMVHFISIIETKKDNAENEYTRFKLWLSKTLKRELTPQEELNLLQGIVNYIQSDAVTNERADAINYLLDAEFLD